MLILYRVRAVKSIECGTEMYEKSPAENKEIPVCLKSKHVKGDGLMKKHKNLIYIVEDDSNIREIEEFALKNSGFKTEGFENAEDFFKKLEEKTEEKPSLILLDIMLPDEDGLHIVKKLRASGNTARIPVIMVTAKTTEMDKVKGLDMGADDYITKPFGVMELISRVKAILRRVEPDQPDDLLSAGNVKMSLEKHVVTVDDRETALTFKEFELLKLLLSNKGNVQTRENIIERVWGTDYIGESRTLDMHIKTLRRKLGDSGKLIKTVRNVGYKIEDKA